MTKNPKQCPNYEACYKFEEWFYKRNHKETDNVSYDDTKKWNQVWAKYEKKKEEALKEFAAKKKIKVCGSNSQLVRIYFRKSVRKKGEEYGTYQKLIPFGWYCPGCKTVFPESDLEKKGIGYFHGSYVWPENSSNL